MKQGAGAERRVGYLVKRVQQLFRTASDHAIAHTGLSMSGYAVLRALADPADPGATGATGLSSAELARRCFVTRQSLHEVLHGLRARGFVARDFGTTAEPRLGRAQPMALTDAGRVVLASADLAVLDVERRMLAGLPAGDVLALAGLLGACADNLAEAHDGGATG